MLNNMDNKIFNKIDNNIENINDNDIKDWIVPGLMDYYNDKVKYLTCHAYSLKLGDQSFKIAFESFKELSKKEMALALNTYIVKKQHWKNKNRKLNDYLEVVLKRLSNKIYWDNSSLTKTRKQICPLCKIKNNKKQFLHEESGLLRCTWCTKYCESIIENIKSGKFKETDKLELETRKSFSLHSKKGLRCRGCLRFIPNSLVKDFFVICPYDDCDEFGNINDLMEMIHPSTISIRVMASLDNVESSLNNDSNWSLSELIKNNNIDANAHLLFEAKEDLNNKVKLIQEVIKLQQAAIKRTNGNATLVQKTLMYDAIAAITKEYPEDMVKYLCYRKHSSSDPIQSRIFQKYVSLMENYLPFTITKGNKTIDIVSLTAPELSLFTGISTYRSFVRDGIIPNETKEEYIGGREFKNHGPCFIGKLINIVDLNSNLSLMDNVKEYSFSKIILDNIQTETPVEVTHFRIPSHYEIKGMVFLQKARRSIVDSIYYKLNNKKRNI